MAKKSADLLSTTTLHWKFEPYSPEFNDRDISSLAMSAIGTLANFLRELVQNVLDSGSRVLRLRWTDLPEGGVEAGRLDEIAERASTAKGRQFDVPADLNDDHMVLVVEDEGCGLGGDFTRTPELDEAIGGFASFARGIGNSSKGAGDSGSKGVGRYTMLASGTLGTVYVHTKRAEDGRDLFFGMSSLDHHSYRGSKYRTSGQFFVGEGLDGKGRSPAEGELARRMARAVGIQRPEGVSGTSILIPALRDEFRPAAVVHNIIDQHFLPIAEGMLRVEIHELDADEPLVIDASTICAHAANPRYEVSPERAMVIETSLVALAARESIDLDLGFPKDALADGFLEGDLLESAIEAFQRDGSFSASASFLVRRRTTGEEGVGTVTYCVAENRNLTCGADIKLRDGISVVNLLPGKPYVVITIAGRGLDPAARTPVDRVAEMLRDGENASHNQWSHLRMAEKGWILADAQLVTRCFKQGGPALVNTLNRRAVENDAAIFADIFCIPSDESRGGPSQSEGKQARAKRAKAKEGGVNDNEAETPFETFPVPADADGDWGVGIALKEPKSKKKGPRMRTTAVISFFYASLTDAAKTRKHTLADFDLRDERFTVEAVHCDGIQREAKSVVVQGPKPGFRLVVKGPFDESREIEVVLDALATNKAA